MYNICCKILQVLHRWSVYSTRLIGYKIDSPSQVCTTTHTAVLQARNCQEKELGIKKEPAPPSCSCASPCGSAQQGAVLPVTLHEREPDFPRQTLGAFIARHLVSQQSDAGGFRQKKRKRDHSFIRDQSLQILLFFYVQDLMGRAGNLRDGDRWWEPVYISILTFPSIQTESSCCWLAGRCSNMQFW